MRRKELGLLILLGSFNASSKTETLECTGVGSGSLFWPILSILYHTHLIKTTLNQNKPSHNVPENPSGHMQCATG